MHIFLTGAVQIGKSTAIRRFLEAHRELNIGGFRTVASPGGETVHIIPAAGEAALTEDNCVMLRKGAFPHREISIHTDIFNSVGADILEQSRNSDLILMDEIGFAENDAEKFHAAVLETLSGDTPVLGVLRGRPTVLGDKIRQCGNVKIITVTEENRNDIPKELEQWLS